MIKRDTRRRRFVLRAILPAVAASVAILGGLNIYYLNLSPSPYDLTLLGQAKLWADSDGSLRVRVLHHEKNTGIEGVPVAIDLMDKKTAQVVHLASFTTDAAGTGKPRFHLPDWPDGDYDLRVTARPSGGTETINRTVQLRRAWKLMLSSDRPVYQPGQTIHVRALALGRMNLKPVAGQGAVFTVSDPKGNVIFKQKDLTSKFGICAIDCALADEIIEGTYLLRCTLGDTESKLQVEVKKYVLPKFKVEVTTGQPYYQPGQRVTGKVQAKYFFGKPVAGATVDLVSTSGPLVKSKQPDTLQGLTVKTNDAGEATFEFPPLPDSVLGQDKDTDDTRIEIQAAVTDTAGQKQSTKLSLAVAAQPLRIEVIPESGTLVAGVPNIIYVLVSTPDGKPVKARVVVSGHDKELVTSELGVASFEFTPGWTEAVKWTLKATDDQNRASRREVAFARGGSSDFVVRPDRAVYSGGDTMHLVLLGGDGLVFVDLIKDTQVIRTEIAPISKGRGECWIDLPPDLFGTVEISAYDSLAEGTRKSRVVYVRPAGKVNIQVTQDSREYRPGSHATLRFALSTKKGGPMVGALSLAAVDEAVFAVLEQLPGAEQSFFTVDSSHFQAVSRFAERLATGENLPAREQVLFARTPRASEDSELHRSRASSHPASLQRLENAKKNALEWIKTGWALWFLVIGALLYVGMWFYMHRLAIATIHLGAFAVFVFCTGTGGDLSQRLFSVFKPRKTPAVFSSLATGKATEAIQLAMGDGTVRSSNGEKVGGAWVYRSYTSNTLLFVDGSSSMKSVAPRIRDWFPETLLWRPELITDDQGRASLDLDLADSITTWRLSASAVTTDGRLGATQAAIKVFQPFFVDINLPVALTRGDEIAAPVVLYNYLDKSQLVELRLDKSTWFKSLDEPVQHIELKPREVRGTFSRLRVEKVGRHEMQVTALGSGMSDAIKRQIEVVPDGLRVEIAWNGVLEGSSQARHTIKLPANAIEGSPQLFVKIYPSTFSQLVEGLDAIFRAPYGCFEQTSSTTYPNVLALDYLRRTKKSVPEVEAKAKQYIHLGYQRLLGFEVAGGGFDWFGHPPANRTLTAYGLMEFEDMAKVHEVDPNLIERTRKWLLAQRKPDGSWDPEGHVPQNLPGGRNGSDEARLSTTAYIAWAVFSGRIDRGQATPTRDFLLAHRPENIFDPHTLALIANALLAINRDGSDARPYLERLEAVKRLSADSKMCWWQQDGDHRTTFYGSGRSGSVETTALAALAFMQAHQGSATVQCALAWLVQQKDATGTWGSTQATVLALKALLAGTGEALGSSERRIELTLNGKTRTLVIPADQAEVMKLVDLTADLVPGEHELTLVPTAGAAGYQTVFRYHEPGESNHPDTPLSIQVTYGKDRVKVGDRLEATAKVSNRMKETAPMVLVELPIPAGFTIDVDDFRRLAEDKTIAKYQIQPRAVQVYLRGLDKELAMTYHLHAQMPVDIRVPAARAYEYYNPDRQGFGATARLTVAQGK